MGVPFLENIPGTRFKSFVLGRVIPQYGAPIYGPNIFQGPTPPLASDSVANAINAGDIWIQTGANPSLNQYSGNSWVATTFGLGTAIDANTVASIISNTVATYFTNAVLTGIPTAPTANAGSNTNQIATTAFVENAITTIDLNISNVNSNVIILTNTVNTIYNTVITIENTLSNALNSITTLNSNINLVNSNTVSTLSTLQNTVTLIQSMIVTSYAGSATGTANGSNVVLTLANSGVIPGTYQSVTVNAQGIVTNGSTYRSTFTTFNYTANSTLSQSIIDNSATGSIIALTTNASTVPCTLTLLIPTNQNTSIKYTFYNTSLASSILLTSAGQVYPFAYIPQHGTVEVIWDYVNLVWRTMAQMSVNYRAHQITPQVVSANTAQAIVYDTIDWNDGFMGNTASPIVPLPGFYVVTAGLAYNSSPTGNYAEICVLQNQNAIGRSSTTTVTGQTTYLNVTAQKNFNQGDVINVTSYINNSMTTVNDGSVFLSISLLRPTP